MLKLRVAIFYPVSFLDSVPAVRNLIVRFNESGVEVDVFILEDGSRNNTAEFAGSSTRVFRLPEKNRRLGVARYLPNLPVYTLWAYKISCAGKYDYFIGVDPPGLVAAYLLGIFRRVSVLYYSLELIISTDRHRMYTRYKFLERIASRAATYILIQDEKRAELLAADNKIGIDRFRYLPNSQLVSEIESGLQSGQRKYFHERFSLPIGTKIALYAGSISDEFWSREVAKAALHLPVDWVVVFHSRYRKSRTELENYLGVEVDKGKVYVSSDPVSANDIAKVFASCDVGLAFYADVHSPNIRYIGKSSGKISSFLMHGKPVVMNSLAGWDDWLHRYKSGITVASPLEISAAITTIDQRYADFSAGAKRHFEAELQFEPAFDALLADLADLKIVSKVGILIPGSSP